MSYFRYRAYGWAAVALFVIAGLRSAVAAVDENSEPNREAITVFWR